MSRFRFIPTEQANFAVALLCRVLGVSRAGYSAWTKRDRSARTQADAVLTERIRQVHAQSRGAYGAPRVRAALAATGSRHSCNRIARLMRVAGLQGCVRRRKRPQTTVVNPAAVPAPNLARRQFRPAAPNRLWIGDITYLRTGEGWAYLAVLLDAYSRRVVGWAIADHLRGWTSRSMRSRWRWADGRVAEAMARWCITPTGGVSTPPGPTSRRWRHRASRRR